MSIPAWRRKKMAADEALAAIDPKGSEAHDDRVTPYARQTGGDLKRVADLMDGLKPKVGRKR